MALRHISNILSIATPEAQTSPNRNLEPAPNLTTTLHIYHDPYTAITLTLKPTLTSIINLTATITLVI